jgi:uncharacterized protein with HEPN domain
LNSILNSVELIEDYINDSKFDEKNEFLKKKKIFNESVKKNLVILKSSSKMLKYFVRDMLDF